MSNETKFKVGSVWRTRGGWKATVVCAARHGWLVVLHERASQDIPTLHDKDGESSLPSYGLLAPWIDRPVIKDWPKWAKAAAMNEGGVWHWLEKVPSLSSLWVGVGFCVPFHKSEIPNWTGDWRESLVVREGGE